MWTYMWLQSIWGRYRRWLHNKRIASGSTRAGKSHPLSGGGNDLWVSREFDIWAESCILYDHWPQNATKRRFSYTFIVVKHAIFRLKLFKIIHHFYVCRFHDLILKRQYGVFAFLKTRHIKCNMVIRKFQNTTYENDHELAMYLHLNL